MILFVMPMLSGKGRRSRKVETGGKVPWFTKPKNKPAVYLIRSKLNPDMIKVGYTARKVETRMTEIAQVRGPVTLLFSLRMPHAYAVEQAVHRALNGARGVRYVGGEWYEADPKKVRKVIMRQARKVKKRARWRFSWPRGGEIFVWKDF